MSVTHPRKDHLLMPLVFVWIVGLVLAIVIDFSVPR